MLNLALMIAGGLAAAVGFSGWRAEKRKAATAQPTTTPPVSAPAPPEDKQ